MNHGRPLVRCIATVAGLCCAGVAIADEIRIGVLTDFQSVYADSAGQGSLIAAELAIQDMGGEVLGKPVRLVEVDHELDPDVAIEKAEWLRDEHDVDAFAEMVGTQVAVPLQEFAEEHEIVALHTGTASSSLTNEHCSPFGVHWAYDTHALSAGTAAGMLNQGAESFYFVTVDYEFGHVLEDDARAVVEDNGGEVVGRSLTEFQASDVSTQLLEAQASEAEVIALANAGGDHRTSVRQAYEYEVLQGDQDVVALLTAINNVQSLGMYASSGLIFTTGFYWDENDETREWSERFRQRHGRIPNMLQAGTYSAVLHYLKAVEEAGTADGESVMSAMRSIPVEDMFATNAELREDGRLVHDMLLVEVKGPSESRYQHDYLRILETIPGEEAYRPLSESDCHLVNRAEQ